jgi:hypothetical protein
MPAFQEGGYKNRSLGTLQGTFSLDYSRELIVDLFKYWNFLNKFFGTINGLCNIMKNEIFFEN